jgi:endonuclease/exonuclease/phosphatase family metal-dependent hydrolase
MRLLCLNAWGGKAGADRLLRFLEIQAEETDIFCIQEMFHEAHEAAGLSAAGRPLSGVDPQLLEHTEEVLRRHKGFFRPHFKEIFGLALFVRRDLEVMEEGEHFIHRERGYYNPEEIADQARILQFAKLRERGGSAFAVLNVHGLWTGSGKEDTPERLEQSRRILEFTRSLQTPFILAGDFNLLPDTESLKLFEEAGMRNLVTEFGITSTRTRFYDKPVRFADYVLTSSGIEVEDFRVLPDEVSDHAPLALDFSLRPPEASEPGVGLTGA